MNKSVEDLINNYRLKIIHPKHPDAINSKQFKSAILELIKSVEPKKLDGIIALLDKDGKRYYKTEQLPQANRNEAISEYSEAIEELFKTKESL